MHPPTPQPPSEIGNKKTKCHVSEKVENDKEKKRCLFFLHYLSFSVAAIDKKLQRHVRDRHIYLSSLLVCTFITTSATLQWDVKSLSTHFSYELPLYVSPFRESSAPSAPPKAHSASSKKGLGAFLSTSWTVRHSSCNSDTANERLGWTKGPPNTNELDLATQIRSGNTHMGNESSAKRESLLASWDIYACRRQAEQSSVHGNGVWSQLSRTVDPSRTAQIRIQQSLLKQRDHSH